MNRPTSATPARLRPSGSRTGPAVERIRFARAGSDARANRSGRHLGGPFVQLVDGRRIGGVLHRTLELQRSGNGRYSDFPVAAVEIWLAATDVFARWCRVVLGHFSSPWNSYVLGHFFVYWQRFAVYWDDGRVRPKCATNGVLSWHFGPAQIRIYVDRSG